MLRFTEGQALAVNAARDGFNRTQVAMAAAHGGDAALQLVGNAAPVPLDAWRRIDGRATQIQRDVLTVFNRLAAASQTPVGIADLVSYFPQISDSGEVHVSMDGRSEGRADQANVKYVGTPVPVMDSFARLGWRQMEVIRKGGGMIDTETIANHQRRVAEKAEDIVLNGLSNVVVNGMTIYGLRNHPQRNTAVHGLTLNGATGPQWITAIKGVVDALIADNAYGRVTIFLNYSDWVYTTFTEYAAGYPRKIIEMLRAIEQVADIVPASKVPASNILGIAGLNEGGWGTILSAMPMTTRPKARQNPEDDYVFGVMMAAVPQFRYDYDGRAPIAHATTA